jgi:hypothetical protein
MASMIAALLLAMTATISGSSHHPWRVSGPLGVLGGLCSTGHRDLFASAAVTASMRMGSVRNAKASKTQMIFIIPPHGSRAV